MSVSSLHSTTPRVALTFDMEHASRVCHDPSAPTRILDSLHAAGVRATFFIQGRWARAEPTTAKRVAQEGHLIGCHSHFHAPLTSLTNQGIRLDVESAATAIEQITAVNSRPWFRCPFGAGHDDTRVLQQLSDSGFHNVHWNVEPKDWLEDATPDALNSAVLEGVNREGDGSIVLLHTWPRATAEFLPELLVALVERNYRLVGVDDLEPSQTSGEG